MRSLDFPLVAFGVGRGFPTMVHVSVSPFGQQPGPAVAESTRVHGAAGDHGELTSRRCREIRTATQASFHLLPISRGWRDVRSEYPADINTLVSTGLAPR